jgi:hypothetical protein
VEVEEEDRGITSHIEERGGGTAGQFPLDKWEVREPSDTRSPEGAARERGAGQNPKIWWSPWRKN